ncbi:hypothetical protein MHEL_10280 [Mycolicibacterium helvum]|uniref:Uncharacterized protein n=1 Tax=Mycolicibacterium helvum TaxID=1534349 RepID=A0A7I7T3L2_9MYCO|nr:hypothetical protein MHEL_10280 [Mycolicibacterium helvum]
MYSAAVGKPVNPESGPEVAISAIPASADSTASARMASRSSESDGLVAVVLDKVVMKVPFVVGDWWFDADDLEVPVRGGTP